MNEEERITFKQICNSAILRSGAMTNKSATSLFENLIKTLIEVKDYKEFTSEEMVDDFSSFYHLKISTIMLGEILPAFIKKHIIKRVSRSLFSVNKEELKSSTTLNQYNAFIRENELFIDEFAKFAKDKLEINKEQSEDLIIAFIEQELMRLGTNQPVDSLISEKERFIVSSFIQNLKESNNKFYEIYENLFVGRLLATFITDNKKIITSDSSIYHNLTIYLDTGFIFNLLGLNNYSTSEEYIDMVNVLSGLGAKIRIFKHVFDEIYNIIDGSLSWVGKYDYSPSKASRATEFFVSNNYDKQMVEEYLYSLEDKIKKHGIVIIDADIDYNEKDTIYQADILEKIKDEYSSSGYYDEEKEYSYDLDAKSILAVHKKRKGQTYQRIEDVDHLMISTNRGLAHIATNYNDELNKGKGMPYVVTDTYMSVLLFFTYSNYSQESNDRFLIPTAYHAFEPSKDLVRKIEQVLAQMKEQGLISEKQALAWKTNRIMKEYAVRVTDNDAESFDANTPDKIYEEIMKDADSKILKVKQESEEFVESYTREADEKVKAAEIKTATGIAKANDERDLAIKKADELQNENNNIRKQRNALYEEKIGDLEKEIAEITSTNEKKAKSTATSLTFVIVLFYLVLVALLLWLADYLLSLQNSHIGLKILAYVISAILSLVPFISISALFKAIRSKSLEKRNKKTSTLINSKRQDINHYQSLMDS